MMYPLKILCTTGLTGYTLVVNDTEYQTLEIRESKVMSYEWDDKKGDDEEVDVSNTKYYGSWFFGMLFGRIEAIYHD